MNEGYKPSEDELGIVSDAPEAQEIMPQQPPKSPTQQAHSKRIWNTILLGLGMFAGGSQSAEAAPEAPRTEPINPRERLMQITQEEVISSQMLLKATEYGELDFIAPYMQEQDQTVNGERRIVRSINSDAMATPIGDLMLDNKQFLEKKPIDVAAARTELAKRLQEKYKDNPKVLQSLTKFLNLVDQDFFNGKPSSPMAKITDLSGEAQQVPLSMLTPQQISAELANDAVEAGIPNIARGLDLTGRSELYKIAYFNGWNRVEEGLRPVVQNFAEKVLK